MSINLKAPELRELKPRIMVCGVGGAGGNAVNNMIVSGLSGVDFIVANTDAQALTSSRAERIIQMGLQVTEGLGAGSKPEVGKAAAEEALEEIRDHLAGAHMVFVTAGMGGGTGTGAAPVIARAARELGILTVGVVTKPFHFEGGRRMKIAETGISDLQKAVDTLIIIPNQNLFRVANEKTTFADAFAMADQVLYSGVACITDLMVKEGLINLDFADVRSIMSEMGKAMMGTGEAAGDKRAVPGRRSGDRQSAARRDVDAGRARPFDLDHRRQRPHAVRSRRGGEPHSPGGRRGGQHHPRRHLRFGARWRGARFGRRHRHRSGGDRTDRAGQRPAEGRTPSRARGLSRPARLARPCTQAEPPAAFVGQEDSVAPVAAFPEPIEARPETDEPEHEEFIPPAAEQPVVRSPRMPQIEDLPQLAQNQLRAMRDAQNGVPAPETRRRSLLEKLAAFGISRHDGEAAPAPAAAAPPAPVTPLQRPQVLAPAEPVRAQPRPQPARASGASEPHVRAVARPPVSEDDHLDIPAFLRRQQN